MADEPEQASEHHEAPRLQLPQRGSLRLTADERVRQQREDTRSWIAKALVILLVISFLAIIGLVAADRINVNDSLSILAPLTAVVGTALGFYFGGHKDGH